MKNPSLLVCDIAGTTIDDHGVVYQQLRACAEKHGAAVTDEQLNAVKGTEKRAALAKLLYPHETPNEEHIAAAFSDFLTGLREAYATTPPRPLPGVEETLTRFRAEGGRIALTTGFQHDIAAIVLRACGWGARLATTPGRTPTAIEGRFLVDALVTSDCVPAGRPAPYLIHRAMEMTAVTSVSEVVAVGDTVADLRAAANAGVRGIGVLTGSVPRATLAAEPHSAIIASLADLPLER